MNVRPGFLGVLFAMFGAALVPAFVLRDLVPLSIWLATTCLVLVFGREKRT